MVSPPHSHVGIGLRVYRVVNFKFDPALGSKVFLFLKVSSFVSISSSPDEGTGPRRARCDCANPRDEARWIGLIDDDEKSGELGLRKANCDCAVIFFFLTMSVSVVSPTWGVDGMAESESESLSMSSSKAGVDGNVTTGCDIIRFVDGVEGGIFCGLDWTGSTGRVSSSPDGNTSAMRSSTVLSTIGQDVERRRFVTGADTGFGRGW